MAASIPSPVRDAGLPDRFRLDSLTVHVDPPLAVVDLPAFDANADDLVRRAGGTPIRVATKSVRCRTLIDRALARPGFSGLMTYSLAEAVRLVDSGHDDVLMAYPTADRGAIEALLADERRTAATTLMVDSTEQLDLVDAVSGPDHRPSVRVCVDIDTSLRVGRAWLGARRSPLRTPAEVAAAVGALAARRGVQVVGLMTYEAQVAGLPDTSPAVRAVKRASLRELGGRRAAILSAVRDVVDLELVNAGGTGSLETSAADPGVTEVTAGSGLFGPGLFTGYDTFSPRAAALFALPVVRRPSAEVATCLSGGYVASGPAGADRLPRPVLPTGLRLVNGEGAGEVQTPVRGAAARHLRIGDRVWFRHAKAGEMCERFDRLHLLEADRHAGDVATYRGEGWNFGVSATALPTALVSRGWIGLLTLANLGLWMALFTPVQVLLPDQMESIDDAHKVTALAVVSSVGGAIALVVAPLAGALSDRTASRRGRRHPWTLGGSLVTALALLALAEQHTVAGAALCWGLAQLGMSTVLATLTAAVPDHVPVEQRGAVSGWVGVPQCIGVVVGTVLVTTAFTGQRAGYAVVAVAMVVLVLPFVLRTNDPAHPDAAATAPPWTGFATGGWEALRANPDLAWALGTRFLVMLGNALGTMYLLYFLDDEVGVADPERGLLVLVLVYSLGVICSAVPGGLASDRAGRRQPFVVASGVVMAAAAALLAVVPTMAAAVVAAALLGLGYGLYLAVDSALLTQVLPDPDSFARDLGVLSIAGTAPLVLAPVLAALVVNLLGGYLVLYLLTAAVTLAGGLLVRRIRSVP